MEPIIKYLEIRGPLEDELQAHQIKIKSARYSMIRDQLYKRSYSGPYLRCLDLEEAKYVLSELHKGVCRNYLGTRHLLIEPAHKSTTGPPCIRTLRS